MINTMTNNKKEEDPGEKFAKRLVPPHTKCSRPVTDRDLSRLFKEANVMFNLCYLSLGMYILQGDNAHYAVAHAQIDDKDPLCFFVDREKNIIINPRIIKHTKTTVPSREACLTFFTLPPIQTERWNKCVVEYQTLTNEGKLSDKVIVELEGKDADIYQHEIGHFASWGYIYPKPQIDDIVKK